jgi:16S rRNA (guanine966-N2)-methyltransferase
MRIVGGTHRGRKLIAPKGNETRPTSDLVREALFDILGPAVEGARFLDAYAGTGAVGIEAVSRGAREVVLVENHRKALETIRKNLETTGAEARIITAEASRAFARLAGEGIAFDIVFLDPPYDRAAEALEAAARHVPEGLLAPEGVLILEHGVQHGPATPPGLELCDKRRYGETGLSFFRTVRKEG